MPIIKSAKKAIRSSKRKKVFNDRRTKAMKDAIKNIDKLLKAGKKDEAKKLVSIAYQAIDKAAKRGVIKPNNASRKKAKVSKLTK